MWVNVGGCGWLWVDVGGCGWICVHVGGCGWMRLWVVETMWVDENGDERGWFRSITAASVGLVHGSNPPIFFICCLFNCLSWGCGDVGVPQ